MTYLRKRRATGTFWYVSKKNDKQSVSSKFRSYEDAYLALNRMTALDPLAANDYFIDGPVEK